MNQDNEQVKASSTSDVQQQLRKMTRRSFACGALGALAGLGGWTWLRTRSDEDGIPWPLRRMLEFNERLARTYFKPSRLAPTFAREQAGMPRINGYIGLENKMDLKRWRLRARGANNRSVELTLDDIKKLPRVEMTTELKCIEGWSEIVTWAGARLSDFAAKYRLATNSGDNPDPSTRPNDLTSYVSLETPQRDYYVGLDIESAMHPQTLLCYEMDGEALTMAHGAPLRLVIPLKYGIKNLKCIGTIHFTNVRPSDYWAQRGYDWYAGH